MFDAETARLISSAPALDGLDLEQLPQFLTGAYALVIEARLKVANPGGNEYESDHWTATVARLRGLADTYEGLAIFLKADSPHREAAAFVAASAHLALNQIRQLRGIGVDSPIASLSRHAIGPEVSACLLFLLAGHQADAEEATKAFHADSARGDGFLLNGLKALSSGAGARIGAFATQSTPSPSGDTDLVEETVQLLWVRLASAVQVLGRRVLGETDDDPAILVEDVIERIGRARASVQLGPGQVTVQVGLDVEGPYHLARLLRAAIEVMLGKTVVTVPSPSGVDPDKWNTFLRRFARARPFLWRNHSDAINHGFLEQGRSFALTFPTGAGKTTITELRIAAEVLRGRDVVCLAPTRALVDQTYRSLTKTLETIGTGIVKGQLLEDFGERAGGSVYVQTPEQCLAYMSHEPTAHAALGLIVVDECHQLSGAVLPRADEQGQAPKLPRRRSVDAMWTLLSLMGRSTASDVVLISAMLRNGEAIARWLAAATSRPAQVLDLAWKPTRQVRGVVAYDKREMDSLAVTLGRRRAAGDYKRKPKKADVVGIAAVPLGLFCHKQVWDANASYSKIELLPSSVPLNINKWWKTTANRNEVAGRLLAASGKAGIRSIVFTQNLGWTSSIAKFGATDLEDAGMAKIELTEREQELYAAAGAELGDDTLVERPVGDLVGVHHGLLMLSERIATESAFQRANGLTSLVATPTVAQGINLPAEAVIIAGDDRWELDAEGGAPETLAVHELLNAAGRAGRAGHFAHGVVIDVPAQVLTVEERNKTFHLKGLEHVMSLFGQPDQCLDIVDPLTQVLDRVASGDASEAVSQYLVRRVSGLSNEQLRQLLGAALGNALRSDRDAAVASQEQTLRALKPGTEADSDLESWRELAAQTASSAEILLRIAGTMPPLPDVLHWSFSELLAFVLHLLLEVPGVLFDLVDPGSTDLGRILPRQTRQNSEEGLDEWEVRARDALREVLPLWLSGQTLLVIGATLRKHRGPKARATAEELGRRFAIQTASNLAHAVSTICRVMHRTLAVSDDTHLGSWLDLLQGCIREGFDDPDCLLLFRQLMIRPGLFPRVLAHRKFAELSFTMPTWSEMPAIDERRYVLRVLSPAG